MLGNNTSKVDYTNKRRLAKIHKLKQENRMLASKRKSYYKEVKAENIMLEGAGVVTGRWGTAKYFSVGSTGTIRGLGQFKSGDTNEYSLIVTGKQIGRAHV